MSKTNYNARSCNGLACSLGELSIARRVVKKRETNAKYVVTLGLNINKINTASASASITNAHKQLETMLSLALLSLLLSCHKVNDKVIL